MARVTLSSRAQRDLEKLDPPIRQRITDALRRLGEDPPPDNLDIKRVAGAPATTCRMRVGDWRVLYENDDLGVLVIRVVPRGKLNDVISRL